jgi:hypothetical protein
VDEQQNVGIDVEFEQVPFQGDDTFGTCLQTQLEQYILKIVGHKSQGIE